MSPKEIYLSVQHGSLRTKIAAWFRDAGDEMLVFVHGLGCSKMSWREAWSYPELRGRSLLAIDWPGFGHSVIPDGFDCSLERYADLLTAVVDAHASRRIHLVAHSMGGAIALLLPRRVLARFSHLSLIEPRLLLSSCGVASGTATVTFEEFKRDSYPKFCKLVAADARSAFDLERVELEAFYNSARSLQSWAASGELVTRYEQCPCPHEFIYGSDNAHLEELERIDKALTVRIDDAGHFIMQDQSAAFYRHLVAGPVS